MLELYINYLILVTYLGLFLYIPASVPFFMVICPKLEDIWFEAHGKKEG